MQYIQIAPVSYAILNGDDLVKRLVESTNFPSDKFDDHFVPFNREDDENPILSDEDFLSQPTKSKTVNIVAFNETLQQFDVIEQKSVYYYGVWFAEIDDDAIEDWM